MIYLPSPFEMNDPAHLHASIDAFPLATLITLGPDGIAANHIPLILDLARGEHGTLIGHVARNNDLWREGFHEGESLAVFQGSDHYITPSWYPTKLETHEVVPTWNYVVVHAYGELVIHDDEKWVRGVVGRLTKKMESSRDVPWRMGEAPADYLRGMLAEIVGIELPITRLIGKWKVSQNRVPADREGAIAGLRDEDGANAHAMADLIASADDSEP